MKKRNIFSRQAVNFLWVLLGLGAGLQFIEVIWAASKGYLGFFSMMVVIVTEMVITGSIYVIIYKFLIKPCNETRKLFKHFIQSGSFQELIDQDYQIFPEQNEVMQKLDSILDKKNIIELSTKHAELLALQNQINPHFLYNTLESIRGLALREGSKNAANMTKALANLFRYNIDNRSLTVTLQEELTNIDNYFVIQKYRFSNKIRLVTYIDEENPQLRQYQVPHMVLQPIVENAVCHGLETKRGGGTIVIMVMATESRLIITVSDDGLGMDEKTLDRIEEQLQRGYTSGRAGERTGIALYNVNERIRILHGEDYGIHVHSTKGIGTEVEVVLPLICQESKS